MPALDVLITTFIKRPYVFAFLGAYLVISILNHGKKKTFLFLTTGYVIAWISEAASIRTGFPYGWYFYIYENLQGEWLNWGVPVWDSLSYTFLCFAGMSLAELGFRSGPRALSHTTSIAMKSARSSNMERMTDVKIALWGALFVMILDIIIDPLAHQGDKWFLGKIYYYPYPGYYFQVPVANFIGWFFVAFFVIYLNRLIWDKLSWKTKTVTHPLIKLMGPGLYFGIFLFNWLITLYIRDWTLLGLDLLWISLPAFFFYKFYKSTRSPSY